MAPARRTPTPATRSAPTPALAAPTPRPRVLYPVPSDQPADYPLPTGHFYSESVPGAPPAETGVSFHKLAADGLA